MLLHGDLPACGRIVDLSCGGVRFEPVVGSATCCRGAHVAIELRLDGVGEWLTLRGVVGRVEGEIVSISFDRAPADLEDVVHDQLLARLECVAVRHVLVVDHSRPRRQELAAQLRIAGMHVTDVATALQAIDHLGESHANPRLIVVAGASRSATELCGYLAVEHPSIPIVRSMVRPVEARA